MKRILAGALFLLGSQCWAIDQVTPFEVTNGLVFQWGMKEGSGSTTLDKSGNSDTGTLGSGASWGSDGQYGTAVDLDGTVNGYVDGTTTSDTNYTGAITICGRVNVDDFQANGFQVAEKCAGNGASECPFEFHIDASMMYLVRSNSSYCAYNTVSKSFSTGQSYEVCSSVADGHLATQAKFYVDGANVSGESLVSCHVALSGDASGSGTVIRAGERRDGAIKADGRMQQVRIWNRALSADEIAIIK